MLNFSVALLNHHQQWLAIDPKGIVGEIAFEAAAFDFITHAELEAANNLSNLLQKRITLLADKLKLNPTRLSMWVFVRLMLSAAWFIEDNGDPDWSIRMAKHAYSIRPLLSKPISMFIIISTLASYKLHLVLSLCITGSTT